MPRHLRLLGTAIGLLLAAAPACSEQLPVYKDRERFVAPSPGYAFAVPEVHGLEPSVSGLLLRPARRRLGDGSYTGSEYGLGKPSYNGLGSRPDWGFSGP